MGRGEDPEGRGCALRSTRSWLEEREGTRAETPGHGHHISGPLLSHQRTTPLHEDPIAYYPGAAVHRCPGRNSVCLGRQCQRCDLGCWQCPGGRGTEYPLARHQECCVPTTPQQVPTAGTRSECCSCAQPACHAPGQGSLQPQAPRTGAEPTAPSPRSGGAGGYRG